MTCNKLKIEWKSIKCTAKLPSDCPKTKLKGFISPNCWRFK